MAYDAHANFAYGTVLTAPSPATTGTSLVLNSGQGANFPTPPFNVTIWPTGVIPSVANAEIARCTALSTDTMTITRHQEGTSARTIVAGDQVAIAITSKLLTDIETAAMVGSNNLSEITAAGTARTNLGLGTASTHPTGDFAQVANNLSDVTAATARINLGLGTAATHPSGDFALASHTHAESDVTGLPADLTLAFKRAFTLGIGGVLSVTMTDAADFYFVVPWDCTILRMKATVKAAVNTAMTVQLRKAAATITTPPTFSDVSGFVCTFSSGNVLAVVDPADVNLGEGDFLGLSVGTGSGVNLQVTVVAVPR